MNSNEPDNNSNTARCILLVWFIFLLTAISSCTQEYQENQSRGNSFLIEHPIFENRSINRRNIYLKIVIQGKSGTTMVVHSSDETNNGSSTVIGITLDANWESTVSVYWFVNYTNENRDGNEITIGLPIAFKTDKITTGEDAVEHLFSGDFRYDGVLPTIAVDNGISNCFIASSPSVASENVDSRDLCSFDYDGDGKNNYSEINQDKDSDSNEVLNPFINESRGPSIPVILPSSDLVTSNCINIDRNLDVINGELSETSVCFDNFNIYRRPVTTDSYARFRNDLLGNYVQSDASKLFDGNYFVSNINWFEANEYAAWVSQQTGIMHRLPTEIEVTYYHRMLEKASPLAMTTLFDSDIDFEWTCSDYEEENLATVSLCSDDAYDISTLRNTDPGIKALFGQVRNSRTPLSESPIIGFRLVHD